MNKTFKYSRGTLYSVVIQVNKYDSLIFLEEVFPRDMKKKERTAFLEEAYEAVLNILDKEMDGTSCNIKAVL